MGCNLYSLNLEKILAQQSSSHLNIGYLLLLRTSLHSRGARLPLYAPLLLPSILCLFKTSSSLHPQFSSSSDPPQVGSWPSNQSFPPCPFTKLLLGLAFISSVDHPLTFPPVLPILLFLEIETYTLAQSTLVPFAKPPLARHLRSFSSCLSFSFSATKHSICAWFVPFLAGATLSRNLPPTTQEPTIDFLLFFSTCFFRDSWQPSSTVTRQHLRLASAHSIPVSPRVFRPQKTLLCAVSTQSLPPPPSVKFPSGGCYTQ